MARYCITVAVRQNVDRKIGDGSPDQEWDVNVRATDDYSARRMVLEWVWARNCLVSRVVAAVKV